MGVILIRDMWRNYSFFEECKVTFSPKIAAALLKGGIARVTAVRFLPIFNVNLLSQAMKERSYGKKGCE